MSDTQEECFLFYYQQNNTRPIMDNNYYDKNPPSPDTFQKNDLELNPDNSFIPGDSSSITEQKVFENNNTPNIFNNYANSLKQTNDNTKKLTNPKKEKDIIQERKKRGRPRKKGTKKVHTKVSTDNLRCKIKNLLLKSIREFLNTKIDEKYKTGKYDGQLLLLKKIKKDQKESINAYKEFFKKTIRDIFSQNITNRNKTCQPNHNKELINSLLNDNDEKKRRLYSKLFNLELNDCLKKIKNKSEMECLKGLEKIFEKNIAQLKKKVEDDDYIKKLNRMLEEFEI